MRIYLILLLSAFLTISVHAHLCPPSCKPPGKAPVCWRYAVSAQCTSDVRHLSETEAHCGCLWKNYLRTIRTNNSDAGECMKWAWTACSSLDKTLQIKLGGSSLFSKLNEETLFEEKVSVSTQEALPLIDVLKKILKMVEGSHQLQSYRITRNGEIAKSRKRDGVTFVKVNKSHKKGKVMPPRTAPVKKKKKKKSASNKKLLDPIIIGKLKRGFLDLTPKKTTTVKQPVSSKMTAVRPPLFIPTISTDDIIPTLTDTDNNVSISLTLNDVHNDTKNVTENVSFREWMDFKIPADQFKLIIFGIILLLNILVVLVLIFCRTNDTYEIVKESKPTGDLNPSIYKRKPPAKPPSQPSEKKFSRGWDFLITKCKQSMQERKEKKRKASNPFFMMEEVNKEDFAHGRGANDDVTTSSPYYVNSRFQGDSQQRQSQRSSHGIYDSIGDDSSFLDDTYEDPIECMKPPTSTPKQPPRQHSFRSDPDSQGSSPIKYFPTVYEDKNKTISFTLPPGTYVTLQDRVDGAGTSEEKKEETGRRASNASQNGDES